MRGVAFFYPGSGALGGRFIPGFVQFAIIFNVQARPLLLTGVTGFISSWHIFSLVLDGFILARNVPGWAGDGRVGG
jgi:hypothetical protein